MSSSSTSLNNGVAGGPGPALEQRPSIKDAIEKPSRADQPIVSRAPGLEPSLTSSSMTLPAGAKVRGVGGRCVACWVVDPHKSTWLSYWDLMTFLALFYTAIVTPVEVAFLSSPKMEDRLTNGLFLANRCVDLIFILDMVLQFRVAVRITDSDGTRWLRTPEKIASNYMNSKWFYLDAFSISTSIFDLLPEGGAAKDLIVLRAVRVLRLAKLIRLARGSRIFKKWELRVTINYSYMSLANIMTLIIISCHWLACVWGLEASFDPLNSWYYGSGYCDPWGDVNETRAIEMLSEPGACPGDDFGPRLCDIGACTDGVCTKGTACSQPTLMYTAALYFAIMTITSVGYGDILAGKYNSTEQVICGIIMLAGGALWGYLIGTFCGLAASLSPSVQAFREDLSALNNMMSIYMLPAELRYRLREYIHETIHLRNTEQRNRLLAKLSPSMQGEVSWLVNQKWISRIWYLKAHADTEMLIELAFSLLPRVFSPQEFCPAGSLYIIQRGTVFYGGRMLREGNGVWGLDVILNDPDLQIQFPAIAQSYLWVYIIQGDKLNELIRMHPNTAARLRPVVQKIRCRRAVVRAAERKMFYEEGKVFRGRLRPIYAADVYQEMDRRAASRQSNIDAVAPRGRHFSSPAQKGSCRDKPVVSREPPSVAAMQGTPGSGLSSAAPGLLRRLKTGTPGRGQAEGGGRGSSPAKRPKRNPKERQEESAVMLAAHNVGLRRQEGAQATRGSGMDHGAGTHRTQKGGGGRGATPTRAQSRMANAASGVDARGSLGDASERSDGSEAWTVEMAAQQEARINGRMGRLEEGVAAIVDRLSGLESLLRRGNAVATPQPSARTAGGVSFFGNTTPGNDSLKA